MGKGGFRSWICGLETRPYTDTAAFLRFGGLVRLDKGRPRKYTWAAFVVLGSRAYRNAGMILSAKIW
jgi:hypothetical protein